MAPRSVPNGKTQSDFGTTLSSWSKEETGTGEIDSAGTLNW